MDTSNLKQGNLVVGEGVRVVGKMEVPGLLQVYGTVQGEVRARDIHVGSTGRIEGSLVAENLDLKGYAGDKLTVTDRLTVRSSAQVQGTIHYQSIEIEAGARIGGTLKQGSGGIPAAGTTASAGAGALLTDATDRAGTDATTQGDNG
jgi:cytoskeletal protein CcmA (bactofilin family)